MKYKVAAYIRLLKSDNYTEYNSINDQKRIIKEYISNSNDLELFDYYIDNGYSSMSFYSSPFATMCLDIVKRK